MELLLKRPTWQRYIYVGTAIYVITGDFNSNAIWNKRYPKGNHSDVVKFLSNNELYSLYHATTAEEQGKESAPTFYVSKEQQNISSGLRIFITNSTSKTK